MPFTRNAFDFGTNTPGASPTDPGSGDAQWEYVNKLEGQLDEIEAGLGQVIDTVANLPAPGTVAVGTRISVVDDGASNGVYLAIGPVAGPPTTWIKS